jgi:peptidoglycan/xylan/chitin deacetylase (PgdA/CDA1 family)
VYLTARVIPALAGLVLLLAGCTVGSPGLVDDPPTDVAFAAPTNAAPSNARPVNAVIATSTAMPTSRPTLRPTATATAEPTDEPTALPTGTPKPKRTPTPRPEAPEPDDPSVSQVYERGTSGRPEIALTFDAGADRGYAEEILDTLKAYGVKASFGITGMWADANPDLVKRMVREGHMVFNHTWSHHSFLADSPSDPETITDTDARLKELDDTAGAVAEAAGGYEVRPYFRPPYGEYDDAVLQDLASDGYTVTVMWSCDTLGWNGASVDEIVARCGTDAQPGDIILMHVGAASLDAEALPQLIETLQEQGYDLVTVEELLQP